MILRSYNYIFLKDPFLAEVKSEGAVTSEEWSERGNMAGFEAGGWGPEPMNVSGQ